MGTRNITCSRLARTRSRATHADFNNKNWGLIRHTSNANPFTSLSYGGVGQSYTYTYDDTNGQGENVDIIFITSKMIYTDNAGYKTNGVSRINQFDWRTLTNSPTTVNVDYSTSAARSEHSEGVVACACHNDYGAATKANIYIIPRSQIASSAHYWVLPKLFHQQKGNSNPTIVINSFGQTGIIQYIKNLTYRGVTHDTQNGQNFTSGNVTYPTGFFKHHGLRVPRPTDDVLLEEMTDAGVIHIVSAGNEYNKLDVPGGVDYNNSYLKFIYGDNHFYNRPTFANEDSITVGNLDSWFNDGNTQVTNTGDLKEVCQLTGEFSYESSNVGPVVDCYVAGTNIPITVPRTSDHTATSNVLFDGSSFSAPTLAGLSAMVLSKYPTTTPAQMRKYLRDIAVSSATMGNPVVTPRVSDGDKGDVAYNKYHTSQNSNLKITYIDPSLPYDPSGITDTTITYPTETLSAAQGTLPVVSIGPQLVGGGSVLFTSNTPTYEFTFAGSVFEGPVKFSKAATKSETTREIS